MVEEIQTEPPVPAPKADPLPPPAPKKPWHGPLVDFFSSVHVAVIILILLATISIIGTVLQQGPDSRDENLRLYEAWVSRFRGGDHASIHAAAERLTGISERLGFHELYNTWYFYTLLGWLSLSLIVCSLRRWPQTWQILSRPRVEMEDSGFKASPNRRTLRLRMSRTAAAAAVSGLMRKAGYALRAGEKDDAQFLFGQKGSYSRLGIYITHSSILVIFIGGLIGVAVGYKGFMQITEGTSESLVILRGRQGTRPLPFQVRCDNFEIEYYQGTSRPKAYASELTILDGGREMAKKRIVVNDPLAYRGIWFYQSSYGETGEGVEVKLRVADPKTRMARDLRISTGEVVDVPDLNVRVQVQEIVPDFAMDGKGGVYSKSQQPRNPAILLRIFTPGDSRGRSTWLFSLRPDIKMVPDLPVDLTFYGFEGRQYTGLQVVYDPGVWVIWVGCTLMVIGIYFAFFISHRRVWIRLREEGGVVVVSMAGNANKNRESFSEDFERLGDKVQGVAEAAG